VQLPVLGASTFLLDFEEILKLVVSFSSMEFLSRIALLLVYADHENE